MPSVDVFRVVAMGLAVLALGFSGIALIGQSNWPAVERKLATIEYRLKLIMEHLDIAEPKPEFPSVLQELEQGRKIQAIKLYREQTGVGLKEAKDAVEELARLRGL